MNRRVATAAELGRAIRDARNEARLTQEELCAAAHVSRRWLVRLEQGHHAAELSKVIDILRALQLDIALAPRPEIKEPTLAEGGLHDDATDVNDALRAARKRRG
ncbi:helix-turn-helix domain-containing protein [Granulicoccus sp. GXG6511]|uniref:helix-turn-helix domain-containing protein n=1 Tax=Granulicoccus sp. GXG6511 TaxID=3381351 RepID=UPI003D7C644D